MKQIEKLKGKAEGLIAEMEALESKLADATEPDEVAKLKEEIKGKGEEFDEVESAIARHRELMSRKSSLADMDSGDVDGDVSGKADTPSPDKDDKAKAKAVDWSQVEADKLNFFLDYICGNPVPQKGKEMLEPKSASMKKSEGAATGCVMPDTFAMKMFGKDLGGLMGYQPVAMYFEPMSGKAIPMKSSDTTGAAGGRINLVPQDYRRTLLELSTEPAAIMDRATVVPAPTGTVTWPRLVQTDASEYGGVTGNWIAEAASKPETEASFQQVPISTNEYAAYTELSHTLLSRSVINLDALIARLFRATVADALDQAFINGSGTGRPLGILNTTGIRTSPRLTANQVVRKDLVALKYDLRAYHRAGSTFICADGVMEYLEGLEDTVGRSLFTPSVAGTLPDRLVGRPWIDSHRAPALGSDGDVMLVDLREYIVALEKEVVVRRSDHFKFRTNCAAFTVTVMVGGQLVQPRVGTYLTASTS